ncbi:hypothetical protein B2D07_12010 [Desulfococcus multivorans]|nr:hypothetical protein B2D07_12010 [Desulfococcus multivorans]
MDVTRRHSQGRLGKHEAGYRQQIKILDILCERMYTFLCYCFISINKIKRLEIFAIRARFAMPPKRMKAAAASYFFRIFMENSGRHEGRQGPDG